MNLPQIIEGIPTGTVTDVHKLLAAIDEHFSASAILYIEGKPSKEIETFLQERGVNTNYEVKRGTIWPRAESYHLAIGNGNLSALRVIAERYAAPEVCDHVVVYQEGKVLLEAYDAGSSDVYLDSGIAPETINSFRESLAADN